MKTYYVNSIRDEGKYYLINDLHDVVKSNNELNTENKVNKYIRSKLGNDFGMKIVISKTAHNPIYL